MQVILTGRNIEVTEALRDYAEKKLSRLDKYFYRPLTAQVTLSAEKGRHIAEVTVPLDGLVLRGEEASEDMYASIDAIIDKLERQIHKFKTRINRRLRREGTARGLVTEAAGPAEEQEEPFPVVRTKRFAVKPMEPEEAILQMNLLGHDFYVFENAETAEINVVYRRHDGGYGLIEPVR